MFETVLEAEALTHEAQLIWLDTALKGGKLNVSVSREQIDLSGMQLPRDAVALACLAFLCLGYTLAQAIEEPLSRVTLPGRMSRYKFQADPGYWMSGITIRSLQICDEHVSPVNSGRSKGCGIWGVGR